MGFQTVLYYCISYSLRARLKSSLVFVVFSLKGLKAGFTNTPEHITDKEKSETHTHTWRCYNIVSTVFWGNAIEESESLECFLNGKKLARSIPTMDSLLAVLFVQLCK